MNDVQRFTQVYTQAPWRKQMQMIGVFLVILILSALVAGIYLSVSARTAETGRSIQAMRNQIEILKRRNADLTTQLADITSDEVMRKRAADLDFHPLESGDEVLYLVVPGYSDREPVTIEPAPSLALPTNPTLPSDYNQSLLDWLRERVFEPASPLLEAKP